MNNKFFCRVVTNAYGLISNKPTLDSYKGLFLCFLLRSIL